ncbi:hypothetical protein [Paenarthrobacter sp. TA1.8]|uniref:hypothetical protein n=1 Tax=Paenarthrobacter sp. TA1.8 TaxID=3400219 RepID=UPI003B4385C6
MAIATTVPSAQIEGVPLMLSLMETVSTRDVGPGSPEMGAMTKYKTFTGEKINGQDVWNMDYHDDDV